MMYAPLHSAGTVVEADHRVRCGTLNVQTLDTTLFAVLDLAVRTDNDVIFLQECWISDRARSGFRRAARKRGFICYFGEALDGVIICLTLARIKLSPLEYTCQDEASRARLQFFFLYERNTLRLLSPTFMATPLPRT